MNSFARPTILLLICDYFLLPLVWSLDPNLCETYNENFTCGNDIFRGSSRTADDQEECGGNMVGTTLKLFAEGDNVIKKQFEKFGNRQEAVLMIGKAGTGKSTITFFLAGNNSAMVSIQNRVGQKQIKDCNAKLEESIIVSQTPFPELVIDPHTLTPFFDHPGFLVTRPACVEIANAYFMLTVSRKVPKVKVIIVVEHAAVYGDSKSSLKETLLSVIDFIPNIESYAGGIGLFATKVTPELQDDSDADVEKYIQNYLLEVKAGLSATLQGDSLRKATFIVDELLVTGRIGPFRTPRKCGPLSDIPYMQSNKEYLANVVFNNLLYIKTNKNDFSMTLSSNARIELQLLAESLINSITDSLVLLADAAKRAITFDCADQGNCTQILTTMSALFGDAAFISGYTDFDTWLTLPLNTIVMNTTNVYLGIPGMNLHPNVSAALDTNSKYIDFLGTIQNITVDLPSIYKPLQDVTKHVALTISALGSGLGSQKEILFSKLARLYIELTFLGPIGAK